MFIKLHFSLEFKASGFRVPAAFRAGGLKGCGVQGLGFRI